MHTEKKLGSGGKMKAVWKGTISFGLVQIPIQLYSAIQKQSLGFNILHAKCKSPVNYLRRCSKCKKTVEWADVIKGMKLSDGSYFVMTKENLKKLKPEKTDTISIVEVVNEEEISPIYYDGHYYIAPEKVTDKAYYLFLKVLEDLGKVAIGKFVMRDREHICAIQPYQDLLLLSTLNYLYEIREPSNVEQLSVAVSSRLNQTELTLAEQLIRKLTRKTFDMGDFKDTFAHQLKERIRKKAKGREIAAIASAKKRVSRRKVEEESLRDLLQQSVKRKPTRVSSRSVALAKPAKKVRKTKKKTTRTKKAARKKK